MPFYCCEQLGARNGAKMTRDGERWTSESRLHFLYYFHMWCRFGELCDHRIKAGTTEDLGALIEGPNRRIFEMIFLAANWTSRCAFLSLPRYRAIVVDRYAWDLSLFRRDGCSHTSSSRIRRCMVEHVATNCCVHYFGTCGALSYLRVFTRGTQCRGSSPRCTERPPR